MSLKSRIAAWVAAREVRKLVAEAAERVLGRPLTKGERKMFKNWQTTLLGCLAAAAQLHQGGLTWGNAIASALLAALGFAAKDRNVTGGSVSQ